MSPKPTAPVDKWDIWDELDGSDIHVSSNAPSRDPIQIKQLWRAEKGFLGLTATTFTRPRLPQEIFPTLCQIGGGWRFTRETKRQNSYFAVFRSSRKLFQGKKW